MFSVRTKPGEFKNTTISGYFEFVFEKNVVREKNHIIIVTPSFSKSPVFQKNKNEMFFRQNKKEKFTFSLNSSGLKDVYAKFRFQDGLVWTVGLTVEIKLRFQIYPVWCERTGALILWIND